MRHAAHDGRRPPYVRDSIALGAAVGLVGVTFGVLAVAAGLSGLQAVAMSLLVFTGASQFAAASVVASGGSAASAVGSALLLAARNGIYGTRLAPLLGGSRPRRLVAAQLVIDESTGMAMAQESDTDARGAFWATGVAIYVFWNLGTIVGVVAGNAVGEPSEYGLDAAFPASFVVLIAPHLRSRPGRVAALLGAAIAVVAVPLTPAGTPLLLAALAVGPALVIGRRP